MNFFNLVLELDLSKSISLCVPKRALVKKLSNASKKCQEMKNDKNDDNINLFFFEFKQS
jgi:hypothetical protein